MLTNQPGIPLWADTVADLVDCYFRTPSPLPHTIVISLNPEECPLDKRGALLANPEEMMHAALFASARGINAGRPTTILEQWRARVLSCTGTFMIHANEAARVQAAMQLRENMANDHETMSRTQLQRVYAIIFFRDLYACTRGRGQASTAKIAGEYAKVRVSKGRGAVTKSCIDAALTMHARVLSMPSAETLLLEMHNLPRPTNPTNSTQRLQAIVSNRGNSMENISWVLEHIRHMVCE